MRREKGVDVLDREFSEADLNGNPSGFRVCTRNQSHTFESDV